MKDLTTIVILAAGFLAGAIICKHYQLAYAAETTEETTIINCDEPMPWTAEEESYFSRLGTAARKEYMKERDRLFKKACQEKAKEFQSENWLWATQPLRQFARDNLNKIPSVTKTPLPKYPASINEWPQDAGITPDMPDYIGSAFAQAYATVPIYGEDCPPSGCPADEDPVSRPLHIINCDKPYPWTPARVRQFLTPLPPAQRPAVKKWREQEWKRICIKLAKERVVPPDPNNPLESSLLQYPSENTGKLSIEPETGEIRTVWSTYARAYVTQEEQDDIDYYETKRIVEKLAKERGIPVTIVRLRIKKVIADYNKKHPNGRPIPWVDAVPVPQPYFEAGQHYDYIPNYQGQGNLTAAPEQQYIMRQPENVFDIRT